MVVCAVDVVAILCNNPLWITRRDRAVVGATTSFTVITVQQCLDYCVRTSNCFGVDVNLNPLRCWPHTNPSDYVEGNIRSQPGTNSYQLLERCVITVPTTSTPSGFSTFSAKSTTTTPGIPTRNTTSRSSATSGNTVRIINAIIAFLFGLKLPNHPHFWGL